MDRARETRRGIPLAEPISWMIFWKVTMRTVNFKYDIGASVKILDIAMMGRVDSLSLDTNGEMYRVVFWNNGNRNQIWMYEWELSAGK